MKRIHMRFEKVEEEMVFSDFVNFKYITGSKSYIAALKLLLKQAKPFNFDQKKSGGDRK